jgi:hypothetical protein
MAIDEEHPEYTARKIQWEKLRDCAAGQEAIHAAGTKYLPKLSDQSKEEYEAYQKRTPFYGATGRTIDGLSGMIFRKEPQYEVPDGMIPMLEDVTLDGTTLLGFAEQIVDDDITVGRAGIFVDHPVVAPNTSVADAERNNQRPFLKHYTAEQIFNWKVEGRKNAQVITQVRLWEWQEIPGENEFDVKVRKQIRILDFNPEGQYRQRVFIKVKFPMGKEEWVQQGPDIVPLKNGVPLDFIPFFFVGVKNGSAKTEKPPLIDLANINISHYQSTADLEHGAHFTGLPTAVITGHSDSVGDGEEKEVYRIGSSTAWVFPEAEAEVQYLEFQGQGLQALETRVEKKEQQMAALGARMLSPDKKAVETAETAQIHRMGETSVLASLAKCVSESIEAALKVMSDWAGYKSDKLTFHLNKDFLATQMSSDELTALLQLWQSGGIAYADLLENLKKGEVVREDRTEDEIRSEIEGSDPFNGMDMPPPPKPVGGQPGTGAE